MIKLVTIDSTKTTKTPYPKLIIDSSGTIVLMIRHGYGTALTHNNCGLAGEYSDDWDMSEFKDFNGLIILSNESE